MAAEVSLPGTLSKGHLDVNRQTLRRVLAKLKDGPVKVTVSRKRAKHSDAQRAYWFAVLVKVGAEATGYGEKEFHELAKALHLDRTDAAEGINGRMLGEYVIGGSISKLNKLQMGELIDRTREWMAGALECPTPDPDPAWRENQESAA